MDKVDRPKSERFEEFWTLYPRKVGKGAARRVWDRLKPGQVLIEQILQAVENQRDWPQWRREGGRFIPHPATWLHQERWRDEGESARGDHADDQERIPSGIMTKAEWRRLKDSFLRPKERRAPAMEGPTLIAEAVADAMPKRKSG